MRRSSSRHGKWSSNGTHAGLLAGFKALGRSSHQLRAFTVLASAENSRNSTLAMANGTLELLGASDRLNIDDVRIADDQPRPGLRARHRRDDRRGPAHGQLRGSSFGPPSIPARPFAGVIGDVRLRSLSNRLIGSALDDRWNSGAVCLPKRVCA